MPLPRPSSSTVDGQFAKALPILSQPLLREHPLGEYVQYYKGLAELSVGRTTDARSTFQALVASGPAGYLWEAAALREAESDEALGDSARRWRFTSGCRRRKPRRLTMC